MGCDQKENVKEENDAIDIYEKASEEKISEPNYQFKNGAAVNNNTDDHAFYYDNSIINLGINGDDDYESVISKLGTPYYDNPEPTPSSVVYLIRYKTYVEIFFDKETGKVSYISCFQEEC